MLRAACTRSPLNELNPAIKLDPGNDVVIYVSSHFSRVMLKALRNCWS